MREIEGRSRALDRLLVDVGPSSGQFVNRSTEAARSRWVEKLACRRWHSITGLRAQQLDRFGGIDVALAHNRSTPAIAAVRRQPPLLALEA